ncbi:DUF262 domain-containing protein [Rheinheimera mesophila]|uniref:DUF262 domain-containing protein n=1 Tax=Rheinheimera mesophila TaxID=1547515 RepID=A0A3P3QLX9_9GAMM|nr:DUF262 domain-containing protein [Rheinheimera mesophila]KKL02482.1 hypothetical protein SD53_04390 [Rheinheimera mesophila]RRJ21333.1 DUF262 domain-containing protein [Rheinheimera mesophila]
MSIDFSKLESIDSQLSDFDQIKVPLYQRSYSWEEEYVETFWTDVSQSINEARNKYFIGPIITKRISEKSVELIDGQQRLTTSLVLLSVIRRILSLEMKDNNCEDIRELHSSLKQRFFKRDAALKKKGNPIYQMNSENHSVFIDYVVNDVDQKDVVKKISSLKKNDSNYKLLRAIIFLWRAVNDHIGNKFDYEKLQGLAEFVLTGLSIINIRVNDESDAFLIFETINDRGRELDTMDLVKNIIFAKAGSDFQVVQDNWIKMTALLGTLESYGDFLGQYWTSMYGVYQKSNLFKLIKDYVSKSSGRSLAFSESIYNAAKTYVNINNFDSDYWKEHDKQTKKDLETLRALSAKAINPILMAAIDSFDNDEIKKLIKYLKVFQFRYVIISESHTAKYSSAMSSIPPLIRSGQLNKAIKVARKLKDLGVYVSDYDFDIKFKSYVAPSTKRAKYILSEIEEYISGNEKIINESSSIVNIEHIMPQNLGAGWSLKALNIEKDDFDMWCNRLGNLCLAGNKINKEAKNYSFHKKKDILFTKSNHLKTTQMVESYSEWNRQSIEQRQSDLSAWALNTWKIDF